LFLKQFAYADTGKVITGGHRAESTSSRALAGRKTKPLVLFLLDFLHDTRRGDIACAAPVTHPEIMSVLYHFRYPPPFPFMFLYGYIGI